MKRVIFSVLLGLLGLGILLTSAALAAPAQPLSSAAEPVALFQSPITPTTDITSTTTNTHPVAAAVATYFSGVFSTTYEGVMALHEEGYGFGVIAKAYFAAQKLGIDPQVLMDEFAAGTGWGNIMKNHQLHPGQAGRGGNLGDIMSGHGNSQSDAQGVWAPPGQLKKSNGQSGVDGQANNGQGKDKDKDKANNGKGKNK
jgi:hypothetical protein